jgi:hypothetical protein
MFEWLVLFQITSYSMYVVFNHLVRMMEKVETDERKITSVEKLQRGDHIKFNRMAGLYSHHRIIVDTFPAQKSYKMIHFSTSEYNPNEQKKTHSKIVEETMKFNDDVTLIEYKNKHLYSPAHRKRIVDTAYFCLNNQEDKKYSLLTLNCEHLALICVLNRERSEQIERYLTWLGPLGTYFKVYTLLFKTPKSKY